MSRPLHVLQLGFDTTPFAPDAPSDTFRRQQLYARSLDRLRPGSRLTVISIGEAPRTEPIVSGPLSLLPVRSTAGWWPARVVRELRRLDRELAVDVVSPQTPRLDAWASRLALGHRAPLVVQLHAELHRSRPANHAMRERMEWMLTRRALAAAAGVRAVAPELAEQARPFAPRAQITTIPVPITLDAPPPPEPHERRPGASGAEVLYVGRLAAEKNLGRWLRVAAEVASRLPSAHFTVVGDGPERDAVARAASSEPLKGRVELVGAVAYDGMASYYRAADLLLLTSDHEGFGRVIVEAALHGVPTVATDTLGARSLIDDGRSGVLCPTQDERELADAVVTLLSDATTRSELGAEARRSANERFNPAAIADAWMAFLVDCAERAPG